VLNLSMVAQLNI